MTENSATGCPVCGLESAHVSGSDISGYRAQCMRCGDFAFGFRVNLHLRGQGLPSSDRWRVSAWLRQEQPDMLTLEHLTQAQSSKPPSLERRARRVLSALAEDADAKYSVTFAGDRYKRYLSIGWCRDDDELVFLLKRVMDEEFRWLTNVNALEMRRSTAALHSCALSAKGLLALEAGHPSDLQIGFCAMWFSAELMPFYRDVIDSGIRACGYEPLRLDDKEHNNIHDEIIASIRGAKFVIADMTGYRGGVYFEAGFAHGLGLPVIYMVRDDEKDKVHFDVQSQNFILWSPDDLPDACKRLENRIRATLGQGPLDPGRH